MKFRWYIKIPLKIILARIPLSHKIWYKIGVFKHGDMQNFTYAHDVLEGHLRLAGANLQGNRNEQSILELGPGESLFTALVAKSLSFKKTYLLDVDKFNLPGIDIYKDFVKWLNHDRSTHPISDEFSSMESMLYVMNAEYLTDGLSSFKSIPDNSIDFIFSNAVLEHVRKADFDKTMQACWRVLKPGGVCTHVVDYKDHLEESLNNLRFSERFWENNKIASSGFYTNRIRFNQMRQIFEQTGFLVTVLSKSVWPNIPIPRKVLHPSFSDLPDSELSISGATFLLQKPYQTK